MHWVTIAVMSFQKFAQCAVRHSARPDNENRRRNTVAGEDEHNNPDASIAQDQTAMAVPRLISEGACDVAACVGNATKRRAFLTSRDTT